MTEKKNFEIDYLDEDPSLTNQKWVCLSILTPETVKSVEKIFVRGIKIRGVYNTYEEAEKRANSIRNFDSKSNVYIGEVGKWLPFIDNPEYATDENYANKELNKLMKSYREEQEMAKEYHEKRKQEMVDQALKELEEKKKKSEKENNDTKNEDNTNDKLNLQPETLIDQGNDIIKKKKNKKNKDKNILFEMDNDKVNNDLSLHNEKLNKQKEELLEVKKIEEEKSEYINKLLNEYNSIQKELQKDQKNCSEILQ